MNIAFIEADHLLFVNDEEKAKFWAKVDQSGDCWEWTGSRHGGGYGLVSIRGRTVRAHRVAFTNAYGPIPNGLVLDHLCRVPHCVRPCHLEAVTQAENTRRGESPGALSAARSTCSNDHEFDSIDASGDRECSICRNARRRAWRARRREDLATSVGVEHGKKNTYIDWGCRCRPCTDAVVEYSRTRRQIRSSTGPSAHGAGSTATPLAARAAGLDTQPRVPGESQAAS